MRAMMMHGPETQDVLRYAFLGFVATKEWRENGGHIGRGGQQGRWLFALPLIVIVLLLSIVVVTHPMLAGALSELQEIAAAP
jgi:hypothetical protein